jgi:monoamine oxidase
MPLTGFDSDGRGVELDFADGRHATARAVILAMPRRAIELLEERGPVLDPEKSPRFRQLLNTVMPIPLYKLFLVYPFPWWESLGVSQGRSLTDLPLHQCYYWPTGPAGTMADAGPGIIMAYNDQTGVEFWGGLNATARSAGKRIQPLKSGYAARLSNPFTRYLRKNWQDRLAPCAMLKEMHRQLMAMHDQQYAPDPIDGAYMDWSQDPYGGGVHFWKIGEESQKVCLEMTQPVEDVPCYVCGEAWSLAQTWAEGALQTAELVLQNHFHLPPPDWVTD